MASASRQHLELTFKTRTWKGRGSLFERRSPHPDPSLWCARAHAPGAARPHPGGPPGLCRIPLGRMSTGSGRLWARAPRVLPRPGLSIPPAPLLPVHSRGWGPGLPETVPSLLQGAAPGRASRLGARCPSCLGARAAVPAVPREECRQAGRVALSVTRPPLSGTRTPSDPRHRAQVRGRRGTGTLLRTASFSGRGEPRVGSGLQDARTSRGTRPRGPHACL